MEIVNTMSRLTSKLAPSTFATTQHTYESANDLLNSTRVFVPLQPEEEDCPEHCPEQACPACAACEYEDEDCEVLCAKCACPESTVSESTAVAASTPADASEATCDDDNAWMIVAIIFIVLFFVLLIGGTLITVARQPADIASGS